MTFTGRLAALDLATGRVQWTRELWRELKGTFRDVGYSNRPLLLDDLVILDEDGRLAVVTLAPAGLTVLQEAQLTSKLSWTAPTVIGRRLYVRDRKVLVALDLEATSS